jgi:signal transduction histidine kinase/ligand-binding sensor domain-containing protein/ActR/RegA family two-component response regulator
VGSIERTRRHGFAPTLAVALLVAASWLVHPAAAEERSPGFRTFDVSDGLSQSQVEAIAQDGDGYVWLATRHGLSRFDGRRFTTFLVEDGLFDNQVISAAETDRGAVWFGHAGGGLTRLSEGKLEPHAIPFPGAPHQVSSLVADGRGALWIGTSGAGLARRSPQGEIEFVAPENLPARRIAALTVAEGWLWVGTGRGLWRVHVDAGTDAPFARVEHPIAGAVDAIYLDDVGRLWIGSEAGQLAVCADPASAELRWRGAWDRSDGLPPSAITGISEDRRHGIWITTAFDGAASLVLDPESGELVEVVPRGLEQGLGYPQVNTIARDREDNLWIGTQHGLTLYTGSEFATYTAGNAPPEKQVWAIHRGRDGLLWLGTDAGLFALELLPDGASRMRHHLSPSRGLGHRTVMDIVEDEAGALWAATRGGLSYVAPDRRRVVNLGLPHGLPGVELRSLERDPSGRIWIGLRDRGAVLYTPPPSGAPEPGEPGRFERVPIGKDGRMDVSVYKLLWDSQDRLWAGTEGHGLARHTDDGTGPGRFSLVSPSQGLAHPNVNDIVEDAQGRLWLGCDNGGLYMFDGSSFRDVARDRAVSRENVYLVAASGDEAILVGTNRGLYRYEPDIDGFVHYGRTEGFTGLETNVHARHHDRDGNTWIGTITGAVLYNPAGTAADRVPPTVSITGVEVGFEPVSLEAEPRFSYDRNRLAFQFLGISMRAPDHVRYRYKLDGFDEDWSPPTEQTSASYANLPPGQYTFRVTATSRTGHRASKPAVYSFSILAPFWMTWWFYAAAFSVAAIGIWGLVHWRVRHVEGLNKRLESMVDQRTEQLRAREQDLEQANTALESALQGAQAAAQAKSAFLATMSHEIRTPMNAVLGMADLLRDTELSLDQRESVDIIHSSGRALLAILNDVLDLSKIEAGQISLETISFSPREVLSQVASLLANRSQGKGLDLVWSVTADVPARVEGDPHRLRQILTNLVGNAIKFTERGFVAIRVGVEEEPGDGRIPLSVEVRDSGIGVDADALQTIFEPFSQQESSFARRYGGTGLGLTICRQLVQLMEGEIGVESQPGKGSRFWFTAMLQPSGEEARGPSPSLSGRTVLLKVGSRAARDLLRERLVEAGAKLIEEDGAIAGRRVDVVLVDGPGAVQHAEQVAERPDMADARIIALRRAHHGSQTRGSHPRILTVGRPLDVERVVMLAAGRDRESSAERAAAERRDEVPAWAGARVLVVDDSLINLKVSQKMLEGLACKVTCAAGGKDALELCRQETFDLVLMDVQMPEMDGFAATAELRRLPGGRELPVVALTANAMQGDRERCLEAGMDDYVPKPCERDQLRRILSRWVTRRMVSA